MSIRTADRRPPAGAVVKLRDVAVAFGQHAVISGIDLDIHAGIITAIAGPNGAGKSTLLEVIAGALRPSAGSRDDEGPVPCSVAFVPQRAAVADRLPVTVRDVVSVGAWGRLGAWRRMDAEAREAVETALARLEIRALGKHPFATLSGGQRQRTLLAQGLACRADLLLLDEPTTGLDAATSGAIRSAMRAEAQRGAAVVCVSHDPAVLADADDLVRLEGGRLAAATSSAAHSVR